MKIGLQTWGSEGDTRPFLALAAGLARAGHQVTLAALDITGRDHRQLAARFGFALAEPPALEIPSPEKIAELWQELLRTSNPLRQAELIMRHAFDPAAEAMFETARALCRDNEAVIGHFLVTPLGAAAEKAGRPRATVHLAHGYLPFPDLPPPGLPDLGRWSYPLGWKLARLVTNKIFLKRVNALRLREGLPPDRDALEQSWASETLNLIAVSPSLCRRPFGAGEKHQVCGFLNLPGDQGGEELPPGLADFLEAGEPPVYFTFGSMMLYSPDYIRETVGLWREAVRQVGCRAVFQAPAEPCAAALSSRPNRGGRMPEETPPAFAADDRVFVVSRAPHAAVLPGCALVVHHGGAGTTQASLLAGRPSVVVPHLADQFFWGAELERLGVAGRTRKRRGLTAGALARSIAGALASPAMAQRAEAVGAAMAGENGVAAAVTLIEARLGKRG